MVRKGLTTKSARWRVIHACEYACDVLPVVEGQVMAGMRPYLLTPQGAGTAELFLAQGDMGEPPSLSLLRAWQDVRNWRKSLVESDAENSSDVVHTHSFASGMAGVRNLNCVVYDLKACIEDLATSAGLCDHGSWMGRSFHVAEQFILARAQAVVVHSPAMKAAAEERGAAEANVFLILDPLPMNGDECQLVAGDSLQQPAGATPGTVSYFVPATGESGSGDLPTSMITVLEAYAAVVLEIPRSQLWIETPSSLSAAVQRHAERLRIGQLIAAVDPRDIHAAWQNSTAVIATGGMPADPVKARQVNEVCVRSLGMGRPLLVADVPRNRDACAEAGGCVWFTPDDVSDLSRRMKFLGHHPEFCAALAAAGRTYLWEARSRAVIGQQYDAAYRHAVGRKKGGGRSLEDKPLLPINCAV